MSKNVYITSSLSRIEKPRRTQPMHRGALFCLPLWMGGGVAHYLLPVRPHSGPYIQFEVHLKPSKKNQATTPRAQNVLSTSAQGGAGVLALHRAVFQHGLCRNTRQLKLRLLTTGFNDAYHDGPSVISHMPVSLLNTNQAFDEHKESLNTHHLASLGEHTLKHSHRSTHLRPES
ncbi:MAG: hypothetical protein AAGB26_08530 [Planctomycetota bacterium]